MKKPSAKAYALLAAASLVALWLFVQLSGGPTTRQNRELAHQAANLPLEQIVQHMGNAPDTLFKAAEGMSKADYLRMQQAYHDDIRNPLNPRTPEEEEPHWQAFKAAYRMSISVQ